MKLRVLSILLVVPFVFSNASYAQNLSCEFSKGSEGRWSKNEVDVGKIEWESGTVKLTSNASGSTEYTMHSGLGRIAMEVRGTGFGPTYISKQHGYPMFISVFDTPIAGTKKYYAVLSRHTMLIVSPQPSQYHGYCEIDVKNSE